MKDTVIWLIHTPAGSIALVAAVVALCASKGTAVHRRAGTTFTISMLVMLCSGFVAAFLKKSVGDMFLSAVVFYTVLTAWLTAYHKDNQTGVLEKVALVWILIIATASLYMSLRHSSIAYFCVLGFAAVCAIGDARNIYRAGLPGVQRMIRHVWRVGFSLIWALLALTDKLIKILGENVKELPIEQVLYIVGIPTIVMFLILFFWIINILLFSREKYSCNG